MFDIYIYSYHACSLCPIGLGTPEIYHIRFPAKAERPLCSALFSIGLKAVSSVTKWVTGNRNHGPSDLGLFPGTSLFLGWISKKANMVMSVIEASKTFSGRSCCCTSLEAECEPWSPQRVSGETQFHEVVLTRHNHACVCIRIHITKFCKNKIMCMRKLHGWHRSDLNSVCPGSYTLFAFIK